MKVLKSKWFLPISICAGVASFVFWSNYRKKRDCSECELLVLEGNIKRANEEFLVPCDECVETAKSSKDLVIAQLVQRAANIQNEDEREELVSRILDYPNQLELMESRLHRKGHLQ